MNSRTTKRFRQMLTKLPSNIRTQNMRECTIPFKDYLLTDLAHPEFAKGYLEAVLHDFDKDGNIEILLLSLKDIAEAQDGIEGLIAWTNLSPQDLTYLLTTEHPLQLDRVLSILSKLRDSCYSKHVTNEKEQEHGSC